MENIVKTEAVVDKNAAELKTTEKPKRKPAVKTNVVVQYAGASYNLDEIAKRVKSKHEGVRTLDIYVKPEEKMVYYVLNGTETGSMAL